MVSHLSAHILPLARAMQRWGMECDVGAESNRERVELTGLVYNNNASTGSCGSFASLFFCPQIYNAYSAELRIIVMY